VEAKVRFLDLDEELLPPSRRFKRKFHRELLLAAENGIALSFRRRPGLPGPEPPGAVAKR
jgi:hypothetical protein